MTVRLAGLTRRWIAALAVLASLTAAMPSQTSAQKPQDAAASQDRDKVALLLATGRNLDAVALAQELLEAAPLPERQNAYQVAAQVCAAISDVQCARDLADHNSLSTLTSNDLQPATVGYRLLLRAYAEIEEGNYQSSAHLLGPGFPAGVNAAEHPELFAELHLLAARRSRLVSDFESSREHLDKALVSTLSLQGQQLTALRLIVRIAGQLLENFDSERGLRLVSAAYSLFQSVPPDSLAVYQYLRLKATFHVYGKDAVGADKDLRLALATLDRLQLREATKSAARASIHTELLMLQMLRRDDPRTFSNRLQSHPLMAAKPAILERGHFANAEEFNFAFAEELLRLLFSDLTATGWGELMKIQPGWTTEPERIGEIQSLGQIAIGIQLMKAGKPEARDAILEAGRKRLSALQDQYRKSAYASPLLRLTDLILAEFAVLSTLFSPTPDYDFAVQAHALISRSIETSPDDALTSQAIQTSEDGKRAAQSLRTIQRLQAGWETAQVSALSQRVPSPPDEYSTKTAMLRRQLIFNGGNHFIRLQRQTRAALLAQTGAEGVDSVAKLETLKQLLLPDEALVLHVPMFEFVGKICIRVDQTISSTQEVDDQARTDARLLRAALTATHPASNESDSQYPALEAVRIGKLLFGGLEDCMRRSKRIYLVSSDGPLGRVPPAALLTEIPPAMGAGFDLRSARWLIRDHSFVTTNSLGAFVATKRLSKARRATLDYLGVGDPVLAPRDATTPSGGAFAARGSLPVQSGSLNSLVELPETSEELQQVASLFEKSKVRVLLRDTATENEFRHQPLSEFDVVHFATHGLVKQELSGLKEPSLVLTPIPEGDALEDGLLTASQIASLPLRARLVVLSACNSARYQPSIIDSGIQGLSTSFAIAGVPTMIASLWPIESTLTRDLITSTFRAARGGDIAVADALAAAVRQHLDGPAARPLLHPRFWAALVVLGDGSLSLAASTPNVPRDLGPFVPVKPSDLGGIYSAAALDDDFVTSAIDGWDNPTSLVRRQSLDGTTKWTVKDHAGFGPVATAKEAIYVGGYQALPGSKITPVLRALRFDGTLSWIHKLRDLPENAMFGDLAALQDQSAVMLFGPLFERGKGLYISLIRVDLNGHEVAHTRISMPDAQFVAPARYLHVNDTVGLVAVNRLPPQEPDRLDEFGNGERCQAGSTADIVLLNMPELKERTRFVIDRFEARSAVIVADGWILAGAVSDDCGREVRAAAYIIRTDGSVEQLWRDASSGTFATAVRKSSDGIEIVGYAERWVTIPEGASETKKTKSGNMRWSNEAYASGVTFSVRLSEQGVERRRDFIGAGVPVNPMGLASRNDRSAIFGVIGSRFLWIPLGSALR